MNYEQKYNEVLERARKLQENSNGMILKKWLWNIFPELKESEDKKWRNWLIDHLKGYINQTDNKYAEVCKKAIDWLEKQCEQKTEIEYIYPKFRIGDVIVPIKPNGFYQPIRVLSIEKKTKSYYCESDDKKSFSSIPIRCEDEYKLVEQKPSWSEDDEKFLNYAISLTDDMQIKNFLKSLKDRVQPQPKQEWSKEDEERVNSIISSIEYCSEQYPDRKEYEKDINWLKSLKDKVQPKKELSEKDRERLLRIHQFIWANRKGDTDEIYQQEQDADWLMTLK